LIILDDSDSSEYYRWRYWEEIAGAARATTSLARDRHLRLADVYRVKLDTLGEPVPAPEDAVAMRQGKA
jgi:hypothetical protein